MGGNKRPPFWLQAAFLLLLSWTAVCLAQEAAARPRLLGLPWVIIDGNASGSQPKPGSAAAPIRAQTERLADSARGAIIATLRRQGIMEMIPRKAWQPQWEKLKAAGAIAQVDGCICCPPAPELLRYNRPALQRLGQAVHADYIWLGVTVVPLSREQPKQSSDSCCRKAPGPQQESVLARSGSLLFRVSDGEVVWRQEARRLDREVLRRGHYRHHGSHSPFRITYSPPERHEMAVAGTARMLANAFVREHGQVLRGERSVAASAPPRAGAGS
jgi:hypothetical protein